MPDPLSVAASTAGFLPDADAAALRAAAAGARPGVWLEIGTYCGKSALHLASVAAGLGASVVTVDHHRGSEENQAGWEYHDESLVDPTNGRLDTLPSARRALEFGGAEGAVTLVVGTTAQVAAWWTTPVELLFLDGNHTEDVAQHDYAAFARHVTRGGVLAVHDVFPDPADGGRPPWHVVQRALASGAFEQVSAHGPLYVLRRTSAPWPG